MEVIETQAAVSNFDLNSKSPFYNVSSSSGHDSAAGFSLGSERRGLFCMDGPKEACESDSTPGNMSDNGVGFAMPSSSVNGGDSSAGNSSHGGGGVSSHAKAAVKVQKVYRSYRTRRRLADSAVVAEELRWQVLDYARLKHSPISFFDDSKPETAASRWNPTLLNAYGIGKGLSEVSKAQILAFQHWIEAIDPRHRYGHNLDIYFQEWFKTLTDQPFFYWLDVGNGKDISLDECPRSKLRQQCIKYLGPSLLLQNLPDPITDIEDNGKECCSIPKIWILIASVVVELVSAAFDQLASVHRPEYALVAIVMALIVLVVAVTELVYKGRQENARWLWDREIPWFYYPTAASTSYRRFGSFAEIFGLVCAILQSITAIVAYVFYTRHSDNPIKLSFWPIVFAIGLLCSQFLKDRYPKEPEIDHAGHMA